MNIASQEIGIICTCYKSQQKEKIFNNKEDANNYTSSLLLFCSFSIGADESFSKMGIYDIAGNVYEWTLEYTSFYI